MRVCARARVEYISVLRIRGYGLCAYATKAYSPGVDMGILTSAKYILAMVMIFSDARALSLADTVSRNTYIHHTGAVRVARLCLTYSLRSIKRLRCDILS